MWSREKHLPWPSCAFQELDHLEPWTAHEHPERRFDLATWLCDCHACTIAVTAEAAVNPRLPLCLKTACDRILVTAEYLAETLSAGEPVETLLHVEEDWVREAFVPVAGVLAAPDRWWSLTLAEAEPEARRPGARHCAIGPSPRPWS
jgi:hypothetical protein